MHIQRVIPAVSQFGMRDVQFVPLVLHMYTRSLEIVLSYMSLK
jgi:hypothetical protein